MEQTLGSQPYRQIIKTAQYLTGVTAQQDVWDEAGKVLVNFFGADLAAFGARTMCGVTPSAEVSRG